MSARLCRSGRFAAGVVDIPRRIPAPQKSLAALVRTRASPRDFSEAPVGALASGAVSEALGASP
eukprot:4943661-Pyramimonas_sp.AAC.1